MQFFFYILTFTHLLFSNEVRPALVVSLFLSSHTSASVLFHLTFKPKKEYTKAKKCTQDEDTAIKKAHIHKM